MSQPKSSTSYPSQFQKAVNHAFAHGEVIIPHPKPLTLRLQFQGLRGALRKENNAQIIDGVGFYIQKDPPALIIRNKDNTAEALAIDAALASLSPDSPPSYDDAESALERILGKIPHANA